MSVVAICLAAFFAAGLALAVIKPKISQKITGVFTAVAFVGGLLIYGYGYITACDNPLLALFRMVPAFFGMFVGKNALADIKDTPLMQDHWMLTVFWIIHCYAIYATVSAVVNVMGTAALRKLRLRILRRKPMHIFFGVNDDALQLSKKLQAEKADAIVFVGNAKDNSQKNAVVGAGGILRTDTHGIKATESFLRSVGWNKKRELTLYALQEDPSANIAYANTMLCTLQKLDAEPGLTRLVIRAKEAQSVSRLQFTREQYGYGFVTAVDDAQMAARVLVRNYPPCKCIAFDENGKATEDFSALIIGFGQVGQAVLKQLVMFGQFEGSAFRAAVFAPDCLSTDGRITSQFEGLFENYDITLTACDGRSREMYGYIRQEKDKLKYVAVCTGNEKLNRELADSLTSYFKWLRIDVPVYLCTGSRVCACDEDGIVQKVHDLYVPELFSNHALDSRAMLLNHRYQSSPDATPLENWMCCDYFSRQSCRAAADFADAMLYAAGMDAETVRKEGWSLTDAQLENLSKTEHLRWCAFHYCMGFHAMDAETYARRGEEYLRQVQTGETPRIRISKDMQAFTHACLISWDALEELSAREASYTGKYVDYKAMDTDNVLMIPQLLEE